MSKLFKTSTPNLFYLINKKDEKVYYARFRKKGVEYKRKLDTSLRESKKKLSYLLSLEVIPPIERPVNTIDSIFSDKFCTKYSFNVLFREYMDSITPQQSEHEIRTKLSRYKLHVEPLIGHMSVKYIKYKHVQNVINVALTVKGLKPKTARNIKSLLQSFLTYCLKNEYVDKNVANYIDIPSFDNKVCILLDYEEARSLIDEVLNIEDDIYRLMFLFAVHGRRRKEIFRIQWYQIDFFNEEYVIPAQKNKSRKPNIHKMTSLLNNQLKKFFDLTFPDVVDANQFLFLNPQTGNPYTDIRRYFATLKEKAGIKKPFRFHDFRHLLASVLVNQCSFPIEHVGFALGHATFEVTRRYVTKDSTISKNAVNEFLSFMGIQNIS